MEEQSNWRAKREAREGKGGDLIPGQGRYPARNTGGEGSCNTRVRIRSKTSRPRSFYAEVGIF